MPGDNIDPIFAAAIQSRDEALINCLIANDTMIGRDGHQVEALPHEELCRLLYQYGRLDKD